MGLFTRKTEAAFASAPVKASAGSSLIGQFLNYSVTNDELRALSVPTVARSREMFVSMIGALELKHYTKQWTGERYEKIYLPAEPWMERPDPKVTRAFLMGNLLTDIWLHGIGTLYITSRYSTGLPASFTWLPKANLNFVEQSGPQYFGIPRQVDFNGQALNPKDCLFFVSPIEGILFTGARTINTSLYLDAFQDKLARLESVPGYLQQVEGEDLSGDDLAELAAAWAAMRKDGNAIGALSRQIQFKEYATSPAETVGDQRKYQALELSRLCSVPAYLVSAPTEGASMTYANASSALRDLYLLGVRPLLDLIEQTFSGPDVLPRNRFVEFDVESFLAEAQITDTPVAVPIEESVPVND
jgi:hypothetical protein